MELNLPKGLISPAKAKELNQEFIKTRSKELNKIVERISKKPKKKDALSSWFSIDELKNYIAYVEAEGTKKGKKISGLRVYFGAYSKKETDLKKQDLSTVFFVPTELKVGSLQKDGIVNEGGSSDILGIDGLNNGSTGHPPPAEYPQEQ